MLMISEKRAFEVTSRSKAKVSCHKLSTQSALSRKIQSRAPSCSKTKALPRKLKKMTQSATPKDPSFPHASQSSHLTSMRSSTTVTSAQAWAALDLSQKLQMFADTLRTITKVKRLPSLTSRSIGVKKSIPSPVMSAEPLSRTTRI